MGEGGGRILGEMRAAPGNCPGRWRRGPWGGGKRSYWVQIWAGLHFRFIFVWIKGALHSLGSQEKHVAPGPVGLFASDLTRTPGPCQPVRHGFRTPAIAFAAAPLPSTPLLNHCYLFSNGIQVFFLEMRHVLILCSFLFFAATQNRNRCPTRRNTGF